MIGAVIVKEHSIEVVSDELTPEQKTTLAAELERRRGVIEQEWFDWIMNGNK